MLTELLIFFFGVTGIILYLLMSKHKPKNQEGTAVISHCGDMEVDLHARPDHVEVAFIDAEPSISCHPHNDILDWELVHLHTRPKLKIKWSLSGCREIAWIIEY